MKFTSVQRACRLALHSLSHKTSCGSHLVTRVVSRFGGVLRTRQVSNVLMSVVSSTVSAHSEQHINIAATATERVISRERSPSVAVLHRSSGTFRIKRGSHLIDRSKQTAAQIDDPFESARKIRVAALTGKAQ